MQTLKFVFTVSLALGLGLLASCGHAASGKFGSLAETALQQHFTLTDGLLSRYEAAQGDIMSSPCQAIPGIDTRALQQGRIPTLDEVAARYDEQPVMHAILEKHGISAKQFLLTQALISAGNLKYVHEMMEKQNPKAAAQMAQGMQSAMSQPMSPANYSFYVAHRNQIMQSIRQQMHANRGHAEHDAACMMNKLHGK